MDAICPVGRRATRKADRRKAILEVAERSFLERGYAETSMSTIAAGMSAGFQQELDTALIPSSGGIAAALDRFGRAFSRKVLSPTSIALHRLVVAELDRMPELAEAFASRGPDRVRTRLCHYLKDEMAAGRLRAGDPLLASRQFLALCQAGFYYERLLRPAMAIGLDPNEGIDAAVHAFMAAWSPE